MIRKITIKGKQYPIDQSKVLGTGGEAVVVQVGNKAVKIYNKVDAARIAKLKDWTGMGFNVPSGICGPLDIAFDSSGHKLVGFVMNLIPKGYEVVQQLARKSYRKSNLQMTGITIADLFINAHKTITKLHKQKIIIGDFNDLNVMFRKAEMVFIDVDSFQFGEHPCMVGTENFLDPRLYNLNLATKNHFGETHDWYAYFVMLVRSLILCHPYGGIHKDYRSIAQRSLAQITMLDQGVKYPKAALHPEVLDDAILELFSKVFKDGERPLFPVNVLDEYKQSLVKCKHCNVWHPADRSNCPQCTTINTQQVRRQVRVVRSPSNRTINSEEILSTPGNFIWWKMYNKGIYAIALEHNKYVLYTRKSSVDKTNRKEMFSPKGGGATFDMFGGRYLVVNQDPISNEILIFDTESKLTGIAKRLVAEYQGERVFACSKDYLIRVQQGQAFRGHVHFTLSAFTDTRSFSVMQEQTWLRASQDSETLFVGQRLFNNLRYTIHSFDKKGSMSQYDAAIPDLDDKESVIDQNVQFFGHYILFILRTEITGRTYARSFILERNGTLIYQSKVESLSSDAYQNIHGKAFAYSSSTKTGVVLHPTDNGIIQEIIGTGGGQTLLSETEQFVSESDNLVQHNSGLLIVGDHSI